MEAVVLILKHATSLRLSLLPGPALIQADLDYQTADVDKKIQQHIMASEGHSAELDRDFIMGIEMVRLFYVFLIHTKVLFPTLGMTNVCIRGLFLELAFSHMMPLCQCRSPVCVVAYVMFELLAFTIQKCWKQTCAPSPSHQQIYKT